MELAVKIGLYIDHQNLGFLAALYILLIQESTKEMKQAMVGQRSLTQQQFAAQLAEVEKAQAEIKRLVEQQKQIEFKELKERISRRLKLEKESGKDYTIYLKNKLDSKLKSKTIADDTRNFIRKRRAKQQSESELVEEDVQEKASIEEEKKRDENRKMSLTEKLLAEADIISLHVPLTELTRSLVNKEFLQKMKPNHHQLRNL